MARLLRTTCNRDCPDSCGVLATVEGGRVVKHRGDPDHGVTRGFLCLRGNRYLERFYSDQRVLHPMRRTRGGAWERLSWDDALDLCVRRLRGCLEQHGAPALAVVSYSGIKGLVARLMHRAFWAHVGPVTQVEGGTSIEAAVEAQGLDFGSAGAHAAEDLANSQAIVAWGRNIDVTRPHTMRFVTDARRQRGATLHVIDPVRTATARKADRHYQLRPGSDGWLALGLGRLLLERGAWDVAFVERHAEGAEAYRELVRGVDMARVAEATDLAPRQLEALADLYAGTRPLATLIGLGPGYWEGAGEMVRLIDALAVVTGNVGVPGAGAQTDTSAGYTGMDFSPPEGTPRAKGRRVLMPRLGQQLLDAEPPARMGWITGANPAATCPDTAAVDRALRGLDFLVVVDQFITASCARADLFLPCATYLEHEDLVVAYGHNWVGANQRVVEPLGEVRSDVEIYQGLARRLGFGDALAGAPALWADRILGPLARDHGVTFERLKQGAVENPLTRRVPFEGGRFETPSGKAQLIGELARPPQAPPSLEGGRLHLVATKTLKMVNAQINPGDVPDEPVVGLHPEAAAARGLGHGDRAQVRSEVGRVTARVRHDDTLRADMLLFNPAAWSGDLQGVNQLRRALLTDMGKAAAMHGTMVTVHRA